ncbi:YadA-like family protein [Moraxella bovis]|uniref:YadA-like family protein n=1 Tax=Moraxella bovis TaxID=476 RepID=UPI0022268E0D|nr:YadA-like family protein [Moraxella bovis]UYZ82060.1 YadA-like family protein [Moraxella bovis]UZA07083.1 YadA-like family protein [Moraxella bovis]UZA10686.1 YadA-like family protein [Moraxella bovis]
MNNIYRVIYNKSTKTFQAVCEYARAQGKSSLRTKIFRPVWRLSLLVIALGLAGVAQAQIESTTRLDNNTLIIDGKGIDWYTQSMADRVLIGKSVNGESKVTAVGDSITTNGKGSTTIGSNIRSNGNQATALGVEVKTYGDNSTAIASNAVANGENSIAIGSNAQTGGTKIFKGNPVADEAKPAVNAIAIGAVSKVEKENAIGLGANTQANQVGAVAIGSGSVADRSGLAKGTTAKTTPDATSVYSPIEDDAGVLATVKGTDNGAVSVGNDTTTRQIINVAAGSLDTDAVNVAQLKAVAKLASPAKYFADKDTAADTATQATEKDKAKTMTDGVLGIKGKDTTAQIDNKTEKKDTEAKTRTDTKNIVTTIDTANNTVSVELSSHIKGLSSLQFDDAQGIKIGDKDTSAEGNSVAIGKGATVTNGSNPGIGFRQNPNFSTDHNTVAPTQASQNIKVFQSVNGVALGDKATAGKGATAIGGYAQAKGTYAVGVGSAVSAKGYNSIAVGQGAQATGNSTLSMGRESVASGSYATAIGNVASATGDGSFAVGHSAQATGKRTIAIGAVATDNSSTNGVHNANGTRATADDAIAMGTLNYVNGEKSVAIGRGNNVQQANTFVLGSDVTTSQGNSVVLGAGSTDREATAETQAVVNGITYGDFKGVGKVDSGVVSVGATDKERQIINVATGKISATSTDAINGSQLYLTQEALGNLANTTANNFGGGVIVNPNGSLTAPRYSITTADGANTTIINNVGDALTALNTEIQKPITFAGDTGTNVERNLGETLNVKGNATGDLTDGNIGVEADGTDTLNIKLAKDVDLGKDGSLTIGDTKVNNSGLTITNGPSVTTTGINAGDKKITNVSPATLSADSKDAVNGSQLYTTNQNVETNATNIKTNADNIAKGFNITADNLGAGITDKDNVQLGDTVKYTSTDKNIVATVTDNQIDFGLANKVTIGQDKPVVIDGTTGTITGLTNTTFDPASTYTGGQAATQEQLTQVYNKAKTEVKGTGLATVAAPTKGDNGQDVYIVDVAKANAPTVTRGNVTVAAGDEGKVMTAGDVANAITNSEKTSSVKAGTGVTVEAAAEDNNGNIEYTVSAKTDGTTTTVNADGSITAVTGDITTDTAGKSAAAAPTSLVTGGQVANAINNSGFTLTAQGANGSLVNPGETVDMKNTDGNIAISKSTDNNDVIYNLSKNITVDSVTAGNTVMNNGGITISNGPNQTVSLTNGGLNNGGNKITNVAAGTDATDAVNVSQLNNVVAGSKEVVTSSDKSVTVNPTTDATTGATTFDVVVNADNTTITKDPATGAIKANTTALTNNTNGSVNTPANPNALATAGDIANAINNSGFTVKANGDAGEVVNPGDSVNFVEGKNIKVTRNGTDITVATADDVTFNNVTTTSLTAGPVIINNAGINAGNTQITNVASGGNVTTNAANIGDVQKAAAASKTEVTGSGLANVTSSTGSNGQTIYNVDVAKANAPTVTRGNVTIAAGDENKVMTAGDVANAITNSEKTSSVKAGTGVTVVVGTEDDKGNTAYTVAVNAQNIAETAQIPVVYTNAAGDKLYKQEDGTFNTVADGSGTTVQPADVIASMQNGAGDTTTPTTLANVASNLPTTYNTDAYNTAGNAVTTSQILPTGLNVNNAATVGDVLNAGFNLQGNGKAKDFVKPYDTVNFINGKGTTAVVTTAADGKSSEVKYDVNVDNASIVIENGVLKATAQAPQTTTLTDANNDGKIDAPITADADKFVKAGDIVNAINNSGFTLKTSANGGTKDLGNDEVINPGDVIDMAAGKNLTVKQDVNGKVTYALADDIAVNQITSNNVAINPNGTLTVGANSTVDMGGNKITNVAVGTAPTDAVNVSQLTQAVAGSKENVVSTNKTVSVTPTVAQDGSTTFDLAVNVGNGLTVNSNTGAIDVKTDGITINTTPTGELKVNTTPLTSNANGTVNTPANPNAIATAGDVANAINNSGWNLQNNGEQRDLVSPSDKVDFINGTGTTAVVTTAADGKSSTVTYNVNADNKTTKITYVDASGNPVYAITDAQGNVSYNTAQDGSGTAVAPSMVTSQISAIIPTTNINHIVGGTDINGNVVDGNGSAVTTVIDPKKDPNDSSNQQPITLTANEALKTYDAAGTGTVETNSVLTAVKNMNEQGTKYIHVNGGESSVGGRRGANAEQSQANGAKSTAIGYQTVAEGDDSVAIGSGIVTDGTRFAKNGDVTYTISRDANTGAILTTYTDGTNSYTAQNTYSSGDESVAIGNGSQALGTQSIAIGTGNVVTGNHSGAIGDPSIINADGSYSVGNDNTVATGANNSFILGNNVNVTVGNSVYLGDKSSSTGVHTTANGGNYTYAGANDANVAGVQNSQTAPGTQPVGVVSVGTENGQTRQIQNVSAGVVSPTSTDAINGSQLYYTNEAITNLANNTINMGNQLNARIDDVEDDANAGVSSAMAMATLPQAYLPGKSMLTGGIASYNGEGAVAVGFSKLSDNGRWVLKMSGSADTQGNVGGAVGAGFHF